VLRVISDQLWKIAEGLRGKGLTLPEIVRVAKAQGITVTLDHVRQFAPLLGSQGQWTIPSTLVDVCVRIASLASPQSVLDPWAGVGSLIVPVADATGAVTVVAINPNREEVEAAAYLGGAANVEWHAGEPLSVLAADVRSYDLIVSCPPFGFRAADRELAIGDVRIRDDYGNQIIAAALAKLSQKGLGIAVITASTILAARSNGLFANLQRLGLSVDALLHLPNGFFPSTAIDAYVALISRN
jgi:type I restriction-modification system DNA methylase subunit